MRSYNLTDSYKRGFSTGWLAFKNGEPERTKFGRNSDDYIEGYKDGRFECKFEIERDGRDLAHMDFQIDIYVENCNNPGYQEHYLKLCAERRSSIWYPGIKEDIIERIYG